MKKLYLVTGAAGHLGNAVVRRLAEKGASIRALVVRGDKAAERLPAGVECIAGDIRNRDDLERFFSVPEGTDVTVIHCAGIVSTGSRFSQIVHDVNVTGTQNIAELCRAHKARKLVYVSSVHAIPVKPRGVIMTEETTIEPALVNGPYAKTKAAATVCVQEAVKQGLDASTVYPGGICGPWDYGKGHITKLIIDYCEGKMPVGIDGGFDFVDVRDVADGIVACAEKGRKGEGYILANAYVSMKEFFSFLHRATGKRETKLYLPVWIVRAFTPLCALYYRITRELPLVNAYALQTVSGNSAYSHQKAASELGYRPRAFEETVRDTVKWLKEEGRI